MSNQKHKEKCKSCNSELFGHFCSICGQPQKLKRINHQYILSEIGSELNFNKGILFTIKEVLLRPGLSVKIFIHEDRNRLVKPIVFLIICSLLYTIIQQTFNFEDGYVNFNFADWKNSTIGNIFYWISNNYGYANILMAIFIASWIKILFKKHAYNYYEIYILLCFIMGISMLIYSLFGIIEGLSKYPVLQFGVTIGLLYSSWGIGQFFGKKIKMNYLKGFISYMLGMVTFIIAVAFIGYILDWIIK